MNLMKYLNSSKKNLFRFEYLQNFEEEENFMKHWRETGLIDKKSMQDWWNFIKQKNSKGIKTSRVRRVVFPLTEYTRMELEVHKMTMKFGDKIRIIMDDAYKELKIQAKDFWIVDDNIVLEMKYDCNGKYLGFEKKDNWQDYLKIEDELHENSIPLEQFLNQN
ncbi:hypothetical protein KKA09_02330 [Patescibacteria group bacterium]|nr:hypothetical protein [Patescibacteria group bacterium]